MKKMLLLLLFPILLIFLFSIESAEAKMYKCRNADGSVTYSDKRCKNKDSIENIKGATYVAAHQPPPDRDKCDALKKFAVSVAGGMQAGMASDEVFNHIGGIDNLQSVMIEVVSYVYSFQYSGSIVPARIGGLTYTKCMQNGFNLPQPKHEQSTVASANVSSSGTGFVINSHGHVLTNAHVVDGCQEIKVYSSNQVHRAQILATNQALDLAVLESDKISSRFALFEPPNSVQLGQEVMVAGFPMRGVLADEMNFSQGVVSSMSGLSNDSRHFQMTAPVQPGNSGGPVIDDNGNVVGVVVSKLNALWSAKTTGTLTENINFAIKNLPVTTYLRSNGIDYSTADEYVERNAVDIAKTATEYTFPIVCIK